MKGDNPGHKVQGSKHLFILGIIMSNTELLFLFKWLEGLKNAEFVLICC